MHVCDFSDPRVAEGIALFNAGEFFACHDVLEDFWSEQTGPEKPFIQGLIQAAVALFHFEEGNLGGAHRMSLSACAYLSPFVPVTAGIDVERFVSDMNTCFAELHQPHTGWPSHVRLQTDLIPRICFAAPSSED